jgi:hypothetical protein
LAGPSAAEATNTIASGETQTSPAAGIAGSGLSAATQLVTIDGISAESSPSTSAQVASGISTGTESAVTDDTAAVIFS